MRHKSLTFLKILPLAVLLGACVTGRPEEDPTVQRLTELDGRLLRIERVLSNQSLLEQAQRIDALSNEVRGLRGQVEQLQHGDESARTQQRELYADLNRRLQAIESGSVTGATALSTTTPANTSTVTPTLSSSNEDDNAAYKKAFDLLKDAKYSEAIAAYSRFLTAYPQSALADNAHYWLGEAHYVGKDYAQALREFKIVAERYPNSRKLPDALLKLGYCQYELKNWKEARDALKRVSQIAADTPSARLAEQRLAKMQAEGH